MVVVTIVMIMVIINEDTYAENIDMMIIQMTIPLKG